MLFWGVNGFIDWLAMYMLYSTPSDLMYYVHHPTLTALYGTLNSLAPRPSSVQLVISTRVCINGVAIQV